MTGVLDSVESAGKDLAPCFVLVDPFGWSGTPMSVVHRILEQQRAEVMVTFVVDSVNRFIDLDNPKVNQHYDELFGTDAWRSLVGKPDRFEDLRALYDSQLRLKAAYVRPFRMRTAANREVYDLFFATNHIAGLEKMKDAMWRIDPVAGAGFDDRTVGMTSLFGPDLSRLDEALVTAFAGRGPQPIETMEDFVTEKTDYRKAHLRGRLALLEAEGKVEYLAAPDATRRRRRGQYPQGSRVTFLS